MIKINHEVPKCLLFHSQKFNEYDFCLPHLLDEDKAYREYFYSAKKSGRYIIMDNSLHELGEAYDHKRLLHWVNELEPDEFIVPDSWENKTKTLVNAKHFLQYKYPEKTTLVAVTQGKTFLEMYNCYHLLKNLGYKKIAFSYGASVYNKESLHPNPELGKALGRIQLISTLYERGVILKNDRIHLLGCSVPQEFGWYKDFPFIESLDTSNPVMAAMDNTPYTTSGLSKKPISNLNSCFNIHYSKVDHDLVDFNTQMFRSINNL